MLKEVVWNKRALDFVKSLEVETRREIGILLMLVQEGKILGSPQSKPMAMIYKSAYELRVRGKIGSIRVIYVLILKNRIMVPHAFQKKSQKTKLKDIKLSRLRLLELINENK
jgi:phage-related protein